MSLYTKIEWCDSTVNPTMGCDGCELWNQTKRTCYAGLMTARFAGSKNSGYPDRFEDVTMYPGRIQKAAAWPDLRGKARSNKPWLDGQPRVIFVGDMSDILSKAVTFRWLYDNVVVPIATDPAARWHMWLLLTKRPSRLAKFSAWMQGRHLEWPDNLGVGTSITGPRTIGRLNALADVMAPFKFVSAEPLVEAIDMRCLPTFQWVIVGGESGPQARPFDVDAALDIRHACVVTDTPYFLKQMGARPIYHGGDIHVEDAHGATWWGDVPKAIEVREVPDFTTYIKTESLLV